MSPPVQVSLDVSAVPVNPAGAGRYIVELAKGLSSHHDIDLTLVSRRDDAARWSAIVGSNRVCAVVPSARPLRLLWEQLSMPSLIESLAPSVHHGPHYTFPERAKVPSIVTIHDMTFFDHPEWHERVKVPVFRRAISRAARNADALIAVSHDTASRLRARFGDVKVTTIPHGVDLERFRPSRGIEDDERDRALLHSLGIEGEFIAFVGTIEPRKNVPQLLRAFDRVARHAENLRLIVAGRRGWGNDAFDSTLAAMRHADRVVLPGFVPDEAIPALLRRASAVAYPSYVEGFGLPALEALACGAPLVTTLGSAMEEVVGDAALLVQPNDLDALTSALEALVQGDGTDALRERGPQVASQYTWTACIEAHVKLYGAVSNR